MPPRVSSDTGLGGKETTRVRMVGIKVLYGFAGDDGGGVMGYRLATMHLIDSEARLTYCVEPQHPTIVPRRTPQVDHHLLVYLQPVVHRCVAA